MSDVLVNNDHLIASVEVVEPSTPCLLFVGDTAINEADIAREMQNHPAHYPQQARAAAARALMVRELLRLECERLQIAASIFLQDNNLQDRETQEEACIRALLEQAIETRLPTADDCLRYFEQNRERFHAPDRLQVRHILLSAAPEDVDGRMSARQQAEQLIAALQNNSVLFADFALRYSACPSKEHGGDLGWLQRGQTTTEFDRQVFRLAEGLATFPLESRWGYHVVCVDAIARGELLSFSQVETRIAEYLELQGHHMDVQHYLIELQARYGVRGLENYDA